MLQCNPGLVHHDPAEAYIRPIAGDGPLTGSAPGDSDELPSAARDVENVGDGEGEAKVSSAWANHATGVGRGDGPGRADRSGFCDRRVAGSNVEVLHNSDSPAYWTHDVHGPTGFEHGGAHASITGLRDKRTLVDNAREGHNALGVSSYWR